MMAAVKVCERVVIRGPGDHGLVDGPTPVPGPVEPAQPAVPQTPPQPAQPIPGVLAPR